MEISRDSLNHHLAPTLRLITYSMIAFSIIVTYYVMVIQKDYEIFTNPDGPETADYFEEMIQYQE